LDEEDLMNRLLMLVVVLFCIALLSFGCSNENAIEKTIGDFESAVNDKDAGNLEDTLSPDSEFYITKTAEELLNDYFNSFSPVHYSNFDISVDGSNGDVLLDAIYDDGGNDTPVNVQFVMRRDKGFFSFLFPSWKVLQYWDDFQHPGTFENWWKRIQNKQIK
jgi:hypothetical protein